MGIVNITSNLLNSIIDSSEDHFEKYLLEAFAKEIPIGGEAQAYHFRGYLDLEIRKEGEPLLYIRGARVNPKVKVDSEEVIQFDEDINSHGFEKGIFVTTSSFKSGLKFFKVSRRHLKLVTGDEFLEKIIEYRKKEEK